MPSIVDMRNGLMLKEVIPDNANSEDNLNEYLVLPLNLISGKYSIVFCLNPIHGINPL